MNRLFIQLYIDEDVDVLIADLLRARGFKVVTTQEAGNVGSSDDRQLAYAAALQGTFLSHNRRDFEKLVQAYAASGRDHYGVILAVRRSPYDIVRRLLIILNNVAADEMKNQLR